MQAFSKTHCVNTSRVTSRPSEPCHHMSERLRGIGQHQAPSGPTRSPGMPVCLLLFLPPCPVSAPSQPQRPLQLKNPQLAGLQGLPSMATSLHCPTVRAKGSLGKDPVCLLPKHGLEEESQAPPEPGPQAPALETLPGVPACPCPSPAPSAWSPSLLQP